MSDSATLHAQQLEFWNGPGGARWVAEQERMDAMLAPVSDAVIALAGPRHGESVIDVGCGCGATAIALAAAVGPAGRVLGLDVSAPMLGLARHRAADLPNLDLVLADAATHDLPPASADLLFSRFGVMFFGDPPAAFANLRRALRKGGRVVFACWRSFDDNPWLKLPFMAILKLVPPVPRPGPEDPGPFAFGDANRVVRILTAAGFAPPRFTAVPVSLRLGGSLDDATADALVAGPAGRALQNQPDDIRAKASEAIRAALAPAAGPDGVRLPGAIWLVESVPA